MVWLCQCGRLLCDPLVPPSPDTVRPSERPPDPACWRPPMTLTRHIPVATVSAAFVFLGAIVLGLI